MMTTPAYLFFGDSYTCCEKEKEDKNRWPIQFVVRALGLDLERVTIRCDRRENGEGGSESVSDFVLLDEKGGEPFAKIKVIAQTRFRSDQVLASYRAECLALQKKGESFTGCQQAFIMVGVNDQFQKGNHGIEVFLENVVQLVEAARIAVEGKTYDRLKVLNIPYWNKTPTGQDKDTHKSRFKKYGDVVDRSNDASVQREIQKYNLALKLCIAKLNDVSKIGKMKYIGDIDRITLEHGLIPEMTQNDKLHYSARMTALWLDAIFAAEPELQKK